MGPAEGFLARSRRLRDLWSGSFVLSWLSGNAMVAGLEKAGRDARLLAPSVDLPTLGKAARSASPEIDRLLRAVYRKRTGQPAENGGPLLGSLVNRFALDVREGEKDRVVGLGEEMVGAVRSAWADLAREVWTVFVEPAALAMEPSQMDRICRLWELQTDPRHEPYWQVYWTAERLGSASAEETAATSRAMRIRKLWRTGAAPRDIDGLPAERCHLVAGWPEISGTAPSCGRGEKEAQRRFWRAVAGRIHDVLCPNAARPGSWPVLEVAEDECLSAIGLVKRLFPVLPAGSLQSVLGYVPGTATPADGPDDLARRLRVWPSTAYAAAVPWLVCCARDPKAKPIVTAYARALVGNRLVHLAYRVAEAPTSVKVRRARELMRQCPGLAPVFALDGTLYYERGVSGARKALGRGATDRQEDVEKRLRRFHEMRTGLARVDISLPSTCYALLRMDADRMGELLADHHEKAAELSRALQLFNRVGARIVDRFAGIPVFSGVDALLAFLPVEHALAAALLLREAYGRLVSRSLGIDRAEARRTFTISAGLVFADYQVPLSLIVERTGQLLDREAKKLNGRDSIAVAVHLSAAGAGPWVTAWEIVHEGRIVAEPIRELARATTRLAAERTLGQSWMYRTLARLGPLCTPDPEGTGLDLRLEDLERVLLAEAARDPTRPVDARTRQMVRALLRAALAQAGDDPVRPPVPEAPAPDPGSFWEKLLARVPLVRRWARSRPVPEDAAGPATSPDAASAHPPELPLGITADLSRFELVRLLVRQFHPGIAAWPP